MAEQHLVSTEAEIAPGRMKRIRIKGIFICLARSTDGRFFAIQDACSHEGFSLSSGWLDGTQVECKRHNAVFDLVSGEALSLPATEPVRTYRVFTRDSEVFIEL